MKTKAILLMVLFLGWVITGWAAGHVKGDGKLTPKKISVVGYDEIKVDGVIDSNYGQSDDPPATEITVDQSLHPYANIEVKDRALTIAFREAKVDHLTRFVVETNSRRLAAAKVSGNASFMVSSLFIGDKAVVKANANSLAQLEETVMVGKLDLNISGSANMVVNRPEADKIERDIDGSDSITIKEGNAKEGDYSIVSSGDTHVSGLMVPQLSYKAAGNGLAEVHATDNLKANIVDKRNIRYRGLTVVRQRIIGKGTVEEVKE